jgi:hypothetical protein
MLKWRLFQALMAALVAAPFGLVVLFHAPRWLRNVVAYPLDSSYQTVGQIVRDHGINRLLFGRDSQMTAHYTEAIVIYAYFFVLSLLLIIALARILRWRKGRLSGQQTFG